MPPPTRPRSPRSDSPRALLGAILIVCALTVLALAWSFTPLGRLFDAARLSTYAEQVRASSIAPLLVVPAFVVGGLIAAPGTFMIGATVLLFGGWPGAAYAYAGMMVNSLVTYAVGRFGARGAVEHWLARHSGSRVAGFNRLLARRGLFAVVLIRLTPFPFTVLSVAAGASRLGLADYVLGTAIGILPIIALLAGIASQLDAWLAHPDWIRLLALAATAIGVVAIAWMLKRWVVGTLRSR